jgi:VanZ family protein
MSRRLWSLIVVFVVVATLLFMRLPVPHTYAGRMVENAGHLPVFLLMTIGLLVVLRNDFSFTGARLYVTAGLIGAGLGLGSELMQMPLDRDASWEDVFADAVGALCAVALYALFDRREALARSARVVALVVALACITFYVTPLVRMVFAYVHRNAQFPVLADFRYGIESVWVVGYGVNRDIGSGALQVEFQSAQWPGVSLHEPVADWRRFKALIIDVENPDTESLEFTVRVHDRGHGRTFNDRYNRGFVLGAGERRTLRIPLDEIRRGPKDRLIDLGEISDITLFRDQPRGSSHLRVYIVRLE